MVHPFTIQDSEPSGAMPSLQEAKLLPGLGYLLLPWSAEFCLLLLLVNVSLSVWLQSVSKSFDSKLLSPTGPYSIKLSWCQVSKQCESFRFLCQTFWMWNMKWNQTHRFSREFFNDFQIPMTGSAGSPFSLRPHLPGETPPFTYCVRHSLVLEGKDHNLT